MENQAEKNMGLVEPSCGLYKSESYLDILRHPTALHFFFIIQL
jgi:hypothetical protein